MRLILIDNHSGYIFGDTADIEGGALPLHGPVDRCAITAARALDQQYWRAWAALRIWPQPAP